MTEKEWLECKTVRDAWLLLIPKWDARARRKERLFGVACCRQIWNIITDSRCRRAVEVAERFADDAATAKELGAARTFVRIRNSRNNRTTAGNLARLVAGEYPSTLEAATIARRLAMRHAGHEVVNDPAEAELEARQVELLRDIFSNPFRPPPAIDPAWREWHDALISRLAASIYTERTFERLPILADALEEAGCGDAELLDHLRGPGPHTRGCWALDLVIGMEG